jgi:hypothetical protein
VPVGAENYFGAENDVPAAHSGSTLAAEQKRVAKRIFVMENAISSDDEMMR